MSFGLDLVVKSLNYLYVLEVRHGVVTDIKQLLTTHISFLAFPQVLLVGLLGKLTEVHIKTLYVTVEVSTCIWMLH